MCGNMDQQVQQFLEGIFGEGHKYTITDGDFGDWMNVDVDDDDVNELHIEIERQDPLALRIIRVESYATELEIEDGDDFDCSFTALYSDVQEAVEDVQCYGTEWTLESMEDGILMIDIQSNYDTEDEGLMDEDSIPDLAKIKDEIRKIKKVIYSHKKKTAKKGS